MSTVVQTNNNGSKPAIRPGALRNKLGQWSYHLRKAAWRCEDFILDRLAPASAVLPYKLMVTSIPKSGSHLMIEALKNFSEFRRRPLLLEPYRPLPSHHASVTRMSPTRFAWGHLGASDQNMQLVKQLGIRLIVVLRDPRDVVVSFVDHVYRMRVHALNDYYDSLADDESRLIAAIQGAPSHVYDRDPELAAMGLYDGYTGYADIGTVYRSYLRWDGAQNVLFIRFEDLVGERGGGSRDLQLETLRKVASFLEFEYPDSRLSEIGSKVFNTKASTFNQGIRCRWKSAFTQPVKQAFKNVALQELVEMGYERDENW